MVWGDEEACGRCIGKGGQSLVVCLGESDGRRAEVVVVKVIVIVMVMVLAVVAAAVAVVFG